MYRTYIFMSQPFMSRIPLRKHEIYLHFLALKCCSSSSPYTWKTRASIFNTIHGWSWWWPGSLHHQAISIYGVDLVLWGYSSPGARKVNAWTKIVWLLCWYCVFRFLTLFYPLITVYFSQADKLIGLNWYQHYYIGLIEVWYDIYRQTSNWGMDG